MGFRLVGQECVDIDECKEFQFCHEDNHCTNTVGSYSCGCWHGYKSLQNSCSDIDECSNHKICPVNSVCENHAGSYNCQCDTGFQGSLCEDIDECYLAKSCHTNATCSNKPGSYFCSCNLGFYGDGKTCELGQCDDRMCPYDQECVSATTNQCKCKKGLKYNKEDELCEDVDECLNAICKHNSFCVNSEGSYTCTCNSGYFNNGKTCQKACSDDMCPLNEVCVSTKSMDCQCGDGFERDESDVCADIDECYADGDTCGENAECSNTEGGFECNCIHGYFGDGRACFRGSCSDLNCPSIKNQKCTLPTKLDC